MSFKKIVLLIVAISLCLFIVYEKFYLETHQHDHRHSPLKKLQSDLSGTYFYMNEQKSFGLMILLINEENPDLLEAKFYYYTFTEDTIESVKAPDSEFLFDESQNIYYHKDDGDCHHNHHHEDEKPIASYSLESDAVTIFFIQTNKVFIKIDPTAFSEEQTLTYLNEQIAPHRLNSL